MPARAIRIEVVTPERRVLAEEVQEVVLPGEMGYFGVLPGHAPLLSALVVGEVMYRAGVRARFLAVGDGFAEVLPDRVSVLVRTAERAEEIDVERARRSLERAQERLREWKRDLDFARARSSLQRAFVRIRVNGKTS
ncbi:MAG: F0F1 ATP synthase subunit epsilon [Acidobacteria bacterium]|nr:F0F1 ATP synthase subunit epsilon [Acidobacteriota bacterium]